MFAKLSKDKQQELLNAYYDKDKGIGYTLARTNIHSCDFSSGSYTYVSDEDKNLNSFSIQHDKQFRIPLIIKAIETAEEVCCYMQVLESAAFMKDNKNMFKAVNFFLNIFKRGLNTLQIY